MIFSRIAGISTLRIAGKWALLLLTIVLLFDSAPVLADVGGAADAVTSCHGYIVASFGGTAYAEELADSCTPEFGPVGPSTPAAPIPNIAAGCVVAYPVLDPRWQGHIFCGESPPNAGNAGGCDGGEGGGDRCAIAHGAPLVGDPINAATGNKYIEENDYVDSFLTFRRFYNSVDGVAKTSMGAQWRHSFDRKLQVFSNPKPAAVILFRPDGKQEFFSKYDNVWNATTSDVSDRLSEIDDHQGNVSGFSVFVASLGHNEIYDASGLLRSVSDGTGEGITLSYSDGYTDPSIAPMPGLLLSVTNSKGRNLLFSYEVSGRLHQVTEPGGDDLTYAYDGTGNLFSVAYPDGGVRKYFYNEPSLMTPGNSFPSALTGIVDELGVRYEDTFYDRYERATLARHAGNVDTSQVTYGSTVTTVKQPSGSTFGLHFSTVLSWTKISSVDQVCGTQCGQVYKFRSYDANSYPLSSTDFSGNVTNTTYDANGQLVQEVYASGSTNQRTVDTTWDASLHKPLTRTFLDAQGQGVSETAWIYNVRGQMLARCDMDLALSDARSYVCSNSGPAPSGVRRSVYLYCDAVDSTQCPLTGWLLSVDGPRTDVADTTTYSYYMTTDESGCGVSGGACHRAGDLYQVTDALGHVVTNVAYDKNGRPVRQRDANGTLTDFVYHARGWLTQRIVRASADGSASAADATTITDYDAVGNVIKVTDPDGVFVGYTYDAAHRLTDVTDAQGNRLHYTLDAAGNITKEETFDVGGSVRRSLSRSYNTLGQLLKVVDAQNRIVQSYDFTDGYDANGNPVHSADALGVQRKQTYDALNRLVSTIDNYQGADTATKDTTSVFTYDARDNLEGVSDPDGLNTTYDYDGLSSLKALHSPDTGDTTYIHDAAGNTISQTDARGITTTTTYDALNRPLTIQVPDSSLNITYQYDQPDSVTGCTGSFPTGRLSRVTDGSGSTTYCYDRHSNVTRKQQVVAGTNYVTSLAYTPGDRKSSLIYPSGARADYSYDTNGHVSSIALTPVGSTSGQVVVNAVSYLPFGPVASYTLGNGQTLTRTYDANYQLTDIVSPALALHFARDAMGNIVALGDVPGANPATETYSYDPLYRLTALKDAAGAPAESYSYNRTGDRLSKTASGLLTGAYSYQSGTHHLIGVGTTARQVDAEGNTTSSVVAAETFDFGYDDRGRLANVVRDGQAAASYQYNADTERVRKIATLPQDIDRRFAYDDAGHLLGEYGDTSRDYVWLGNLPVATVDITGTAIQVNYLHDDGAGTPRAATGVAGAVSWRWSFTGNPFGERAAESLTGYSLNIRFPGQYYDAESGLMNNWARDYESGTGRYVQSDPAGLAGGMSTYEYARQNPLGYTDPTGLVPNPAELTCIDPFQPVCWGGVAADLVTNIVGGAMMAGVIGGSGSIAQDAQRQAEYERYKQRCEEPPPPGLDRCALLRWQLNQAKECVGLRQSWDDKWSPGRHEQAIADWTNRVRNIEARIEKECKVCP